MPTRGSLLQHCFFTCSYSAKCWGNLFSLFDVAWVFYGLFRSNVEQIFKKKRKKETSLAIKKMNRQSSVECNEETRSTPLGPASATRLPPLSTLITSRKWSSLRFVVFSPYSRVFHINLVFSFLPFNMLSERGDITVAAIGKNQSVQDNLSYTSLVFRV